jgi:L-asparaginase II
MMAPLLVEVTRRDVRTGADIIESVHHGHLVVTGPGGEVVMSLGDPDVSTLVRSAAKPFQVQACLDVLGEAGADLTTQEIAVAWSSHRAEPRHLGLVQRLLERSGTDAASLTCPAAVGEADPGASPARIQRDCSGKHALFALVGQKLGLAGADVIDPAGAVQRAVLQVLEEALGPMDALATDGCGAPAVAVPLVNLARGFAAVATGARWSRVRDAGLAHPGLVGGDGRAETALLEAGIVAKPGAEGVFGIGLTDAHGRPFGAAIKILDGSSRGSATAAVGLLEALGHVGPGTWAAPAPTGGELPVGEVRPSSLVCGLGRRRP